MMIMIMMIMMMMIMMMMMIRSAIATRKHHGQYNSLIDMFSSPTDVQARRGYSVRQCYCAIAEISHL